MSSCKCLLFRDRTLAVSFLCDDDGDSGGGDGGDEDQGDDVVTQ